MSDTNLWLRYWSMGCQLSPSGNWMAYTDIQKRQKAADVLPLKKTMVKYAISISSDLIGS
jgi:hypothetical protein